MIDSSSSNNINTVKENKKIPNKKSKLEKLSIALKQNILRRKQVSQRLQNSK